MGLVTGFNSISLWQSQSRRDPWKLVALQKRPGSIIFPFQCRYNFQAIGAKSLFLPSRNVQRCSKPNYILNSTKHSSRQPLNFCTSFNHETLNVTHFSLTMPQNGLQQFHSKAQTSIIRTCHRSKAAEINVKACAWMNQNETCGFQLKGRNSFMHRYWRIINGPSWIPRSIIPSFRQPFSSW